MNNILVTGGAGFIGSHVVRHFLDTHPEVHISIMDILREEKLAQATINDLLKDFPGRVKFYKADIRDKAQVEEVFAEGNFDTVLHFAAIGSNLVALRDPTLSRETNIGGTRNMLEISAKYGVEKFFHQSTDEVYGDLDEHGVSAFTPELALLPNSPYARTKAGADRMSRIAEKKTEMAVYVARPSNNYGPRQHPDAVTNKMIRAAMDGKRLQIYGDGNQTREWTYVGDMARAVDIILEKGTPGVVYNVGSGEGTTINKLAEIIADAYHVEIEHLPPREKDDRGYKLDSTALRELGWKPEVGFEEGMINTMNWYKDKYQRQSDLWEGTEAHPVPGKLRAHRSGTPEAI